MQRVEAELRLLAKEAARETEVLPVLGEAAFVSRALFPARPASALFGIWDSKSVTLRLELAERRQNE